MKHIYLLAMAVMLSIASYSQTLLAQWSFPSGTATDSIADAGVSANLNKAIRGTGTSAIDFSKNGNATKAAQTTGWDNGAGTKCWQVSFSTKGYATIKISSRQQSGGNNPGPKDFKLQYSIGTSGTWTDVTGGTITTANDWTTSFVNNLALPAECDNQDLVFVRWLMNSNTPSSGSGNVASSGISKIDDIQINADITTGIDEPAGIAALRIYPNPVTGGMFTLETSQENYLLEIMDLQGKPVKSIRSLEGSLQVETQNWSKGTYVIRLTSARGRVQSKVVVE